MKLLLKNGRLIDPISGRDERTNMLIIDGIIEKIGSHVSGITAADEINLQGKIIAPGFVDMHVHAREPGFEHKENLETVIAAAVAGGFTAICCMPNTEPPIDSASVVEFIRKRSRDVLGGVVDVYPIAAVTKGREGVQLAPMAELANAGAVGFSDDGSPVESAEIMRRAFEYSEMYGKPIIQHAEERSMAHGGVMNEGVVATSLGLPPIPPLAEELMIERDISILRYLINEKIGSANNQPNALRYHVAHISTAGSVEIIRRAKMQGLPVTCEVTPHHFSLTEEAVRFFDTNTKMNPPLRTLQDIEAIKEGLRDGTIDVIATDHAPHSFDEKQVEFVNAPFGVVGLETALGLAIRELVAKNVLSLAQIIEKMSTNPRRIVHLPQLVIAPGERANFTILDPEVEWVVNTSAFKSRSKNSPFHGWKLKGKPFAIVNNGSYLLS